MSGLNTYFVPLTILQEQFWDKLTDAPLAGGVLSFYQDEARTIPKSVYVLTGNPPDYTYAVASPSDSSITLSSIGTVDDSMGNNLVIYGYPYDDTNFDGSGNIELYYMTVYSSDGIFQFSVGGFPNVPFEETPQASGQEKNFIKNGQFVLNNGTQAISATNTELAYGGWYYSRSSNTSTDAITFPRFGSPIAGGVPSGNPRYSCNVACTVTGADSSKVLEIRFNDVNRFSDAVQTLSLYFMAKSSAGSSITVNLYKYFGIGGSGPETTQIISSTVLTSAWEPVRVSFPFGSNVGKTLGANDDDYFSIQVSFNPALTFNVTVTDFVLYLGSESITAYPFGVNSYNDLQIYNMSIPHTTYLTALFPLVINTSWQAITGTSITIQPGVYLLSYSCSMTIAVHTGLYGHGGYTAIFNNTTGLILANTECHPVFVTSNAPLTFSNNESCGNGAATILLRITVPTILQIYAKLDYTDAVYAMSVTNACINAMKVG
jgi:hypothetical protein